MNDQNAVSENNSSILLFAVWLMALLGMVGSLFFSEVLDYPPCVLCWYQRIALYPLVFVVGIGIAIRDRRTALYGLPLTAAGLVVAAYHNLLYYGLIPEEITPCTEGIPCNAIQLQLLGFLTIPLMSLLAFVAIAVCLIIYHFRNK